jgi:hypothetical protein
VLDNGLTTKALTAGINAAIANNLIVSVISKGNTVMYFKKVRG